MMNSNAPIKINEKKVEDTEANQANYKITLVDDTIIEFLKVYKIIVENNFMEVIAFKNGRQVTIDIFSFVDIRRISLVSAEGEHFIKHRKGRDKN